MSSSLPKRHPLNDSERSEMIAAFEDYPYGVASPFHPQNTPSVFDVWTKLQTEHVNSFQHWPDEFVAYIPLELTLHDINTRLKEQDQCLKLPLPDQWTLAQVIAYAPSLISDGWQMPLRQRILGLQWLDVQGHLIGSGGRVLKNVTGYDLHRFHLGFHSSLGLPIAACIRTFRCSPYPMQAFEYTLEDTAEGLPRLEAFYQKLKAAPPQGIQAFSLEKAQASWKASLLWDAHPDILTHCLKGSSFTEAPTPCDPFNRNDFSLYCESRMPLSLDYFKDVLEDLNTDALRYQFAHQHLSLGWKEAPIQLPKYLEDEKTPKQIWTSPPEWTNWQRKQWHAQMPLVLWKEWSALRQAWKIKATQLQSPYWGDRQEDLTHESSISNLLPH
ncbi:MAG: hypothetical protein HEQ32_01435 [Vampirovibrio sp.]